jgi:dTDP-4-dehydrorhamnose 3,5-epimerase-like enzyme
LRGFCTLEDNTEVRYKCDNYFDGQADSSVAWDDPDINIGWPIKDPLLSDRDKYARPAVDYFKGEL